MHLYPLPWHRKPKRPVSTHLSSPTQHSHFAISVSLPGRAFAGPLQAAKASLSVRHELSHFSPQRKEVAGVEQHVAPGWPSEELASLPHHTRGRRVTATGTIKRVGNGGGGGGPGELEIEPTRFGGWRGVGCLQRQARPVTEAWS